MYTSKAGGEVGYPLNRFKPPIVLNYWPCQCGTSDVDLYVPCFGVSFFTVSPFVCLSIFIFRFR